jgi:FlaA1/EpsC-like NDP-sugar epimerase
MKERLLITGGTGFLGRHLALALKDRYEVCITGRNNKQNFLSERFTGVKTLPMDVSDIESVRDGFIEFKPDYVVHAAATKFVDLSERQPMECVDVNVTGSQNVARVAVERGIKKVVGVSTDKAAPPIRNIYGLSKSMMERMYCSMDTKADTRFACVRYGNVAWSTGSVLPLWTQMFKETQVIRSTGPDMTRFFFTVDEAVALVITCLENMQELHGRVLSRRMKAARIRDILDLWVKERGGRWEKMEGRPGDRPQEYLIGETELEYTFARNYGGITHYVVTFNERAKEPLREVVSSDNAERLTAAEISRLINHPTEGAT